MQHPAPGLCCLVLDEASRTVKVAPTLEPAAAVNLEYLLLALKVRKTAKREPLFSLDPVDHQNLEKTPQKKVYEPSWLAGTSVGDVMFQADYFLKELALGEYTMPVACLTESALYICHRLVLCRFAGANVPGFPCLYTMNYQSAICTVPAESQSLMEHFSKRALLA